MKERGGRWAQELMNIKKFGKGKWTTQPTKQKGGKYAQELMNTKEIKKDDQQHK